MLSKWLENLSKKKRVIFFYNKVEDGIQELRRHKNDKFGWIGAYSVSSKHVKVYNVNTPSIEIEGIQLIATEIARYLLMINKPPKGYRRITAEQLDKTPPPLYAEPSIFDGVYIDIKSCYYHLIEKLYGIKYARNHWLGVDKEINPWNIPKEFEAILNEYKPIRNALYGLMRTRYRIVWKIKNGKIDYTVQNTKNDLFYPDICLAIMDITQALSTIAVKTYNAKYVAIDGFILPEKKAKPFKAFLESLGFKTGIKAEGKAIVKNYYTYSIGDTRTKTYETYKTTFNSTR
jgi:hypothetical protein